MATKDSYIRFRIEADLKELFFFFFSSMNKVQTKIIRRQIIEWLEKNGVIYDEDFESWNLVKSHALKTTNKKKDLSLLKTLW